MFKKGLWENVVATFTFMVGTQLGSWLKHRATSRKIAGSVSSGSFEVFPWLNRSGETGIFSEG